jgi:hypothetical protein
MGLAVAPAGPRGDGEGALGLDGGAEDPVRGDDGRGGEEEGGEGAGVREHGEVQAGDVLSAVDLCHGGCNDAAPVAAVHDVLVNGQFGHEFQEDLCCRDGIEPCRRRCIGESVAWETRYDYFVAHVVFTAGEFWNDIQEFEYASWPTVKKKNRSNGFGRTNRFFMNEPDGKPFDHNIKLFKGFKLLYCG